MTKEQKIEWLENATNEEVVEQMKWAAVNAMSDRISVRIEANEDMQLIKAEILKRMGG